MMPTLRLAVDRSATMWDASLPVIVGTISAYAVTAVSGLVAASMAVPLAFILLLISGGVGLVVGIASVVWLIPVGCVVANLLFLWKIRPLFKPASIFGSRFYLVGYGLYFLLAPGLAFFADDILQFSARDRENVVYSDRGVQAVSELPIYLPSTYLRQRGVSDGRLIVPLSTERCMMECVRILADTNVQAIVVHRALNDQQRPHPLGHRSFRFTFAEGDGCRGRDGAVASLASRNCVTAQQVPYAPPQGLYAEIHRSIDSSLFVTTSEAVLHLKSAERGHVTDIATFRSGVTEATALFKALRYPFHIFQIGSGTDPHIAAFGNASAIRPGIVSPMYGLLEFLDPGTG